MLAGAMYSIEKCRKPVIKCHHFASPHVDIWSSFPDVVLGIRQRHDFFPVSDAIIFK